MLNLSLQEKVDLFRSLFKEREDVFARRWYSKTSGKAGYQPVCENEWTPLCDKKTFKCADCPNRQFLPLTENDVYRHLEGKDADGIVERMTRPQIEKLIAETTRRMKEAAKKMDFLQAAQYRDEILRLQKEIEL
jgi:hypothetical protein